MYFVGNESSNLALPDSDEFSESVEDLKKYQVEGPKYRNECLDRARRDVAQERERNQRYTAHYQNFELTVCRAEVRNWRHYFAEVFQQHKITKPEKNRLFDPRI